MIKAKLDFLQPDYIFKEHELKGEDKCVPIGLFTKVNDSTMLNKIIDTNTFRNIGATFAWTKTIFTITTQCAMVVTCAFSQRTLPILKC